MSCWPAIALSMASAKALTLQVSAAWLTQWRPVGCGLPAIGDLYSAYPALPGGSRRWKRHGDAGGTLQVPAAASIQRKKICWLKMGSLLKSVSGYIWECSIHQKIALKNCCFWFWLLKHLNNLFLVLSAEKCTSRTSLLSFYQLPFFCCQCLFQPCGLNALLMVCVHCLKCRCTAKYSCYQCVQVMLHCNLDPGRLGLHLWREF
jgi:hypothetical protein